MKPVAWMIVHKGCEVGCVETVESVALQRALNEGAAEVVPLYRAPQPEAASTWERISDIGPMPSPHFIWSSERLTVYLRRCVTGKHEDTEWFRLELPPLPQSAPSSGGQVTPSQDRMKAAVAYLQKFMATYDQQLGYLDYTDETYINDVLYGLGVSLGGEHQYASGFDAFKEKLRVHLGSQKDEA